MGRKHSDGGYRLSSYDPKAEEEVIRAAARLLFLALNPSHHEQSEYYELYKQYLRNPNIGIIIQYMGEEFNLQISKISEQGIFLTPNLKSFFATRADDIYIVKKTEDKHILGLIFLGVAALIYPNIRFLEDETYEGRKFNWKEVDQLIRSIAEKVRKTFPSYEQNPNHEQPELSPVLFNYLKIKADKGSTRDRTTTRYYFSKAFEYLTDQGFIVQIDEKSYHPTLKFKYHVKDLVQDNYFIELLRLKGDDNNSTNK